jgi:hypothetical protein
MGMTIAAVPVAQTTFNFVNFCSLAFVFPFRVEGCVFSLGLGLLSIS